MMRNIHPLIHKCQPYLQELQYKLYGAACLFNNWEKVDRVITGKSSPTLVDQPRLEELTSVWATQCPESKIKFKGEITNVLVINNSGM